MKKDSIISSIVSIVLLILLIAARVAHPLFMIPFVIIFAGILIWCEKEEQKEINLKTNKENKTTEVI